MKIFAAVVITAWGLPLLGCAAAGCVDRFIPAASKGELFVEREGACSLNGTFILLRKGGGVIAVRFPAFAAAVNGKEDEGCGQYEAFFAPDGRFQAAAAERGVLSEFALRGFHPIAWQPGRDHLHIGKTTLAYFHPGCVSLLDDPPSDQDVEFTVTRWRRIEDVNVLDPALVWHKRDAERREEKVIFD